MSVTVQAGGKAADWVDERLSSSNFLSRSMRKVFPDHWSFMLGEIALYSFIVILLSGTYLTLFFKPSLTEIVYNGSFVPLRGIKMTEAYASTLDISFDVRGGLLVRQIHHWAALFFVGAISVHLLRVFFTGAFRKPREINWLIGVGLLTMALAAGFSGYSLPDDLLSGTGLRIAQSILQSLPLVGTWLSFLLLNGEFPGVDWVSRLYAVHILLVPGLILALVTVHLMMVWFQKHTQFPGPGRTEDNVVGYRLMPVYMAKAGGFFFVVFGVIAVIAGVITINPIWAYGPYTPTQITAGSQPDFYIGWLDGALRVTPGIETTIWGVTIPWNILIPAVIVPGIIFTLMGLYPWIEAWATGDKREHHLLDRPRNAPTRTGLGVMALTFYILLWINGGNDIIAYNFQLSINQITWFTRIAMFTLPPIMFLITKRTCLSLQRRDREKLLHGRETGKVLRLPHGEFIEIHAPLSLKEQAVILSKPDTAVLALPPAVDSNGVRRKGGPIGAIRERVSRFYYDDNVAKPSPAELAEAEAHLSHEVAIEAPTVAHHQLLQADGGVIVEPSRDEVAEEVRT